MANTIATPTWVTKEVAYYFDNSLRGASNFDRSYSDQYVQAGARVGDTVKARLPQLWQVRTGQGFDQQNILDRTVDIILNNQKGVDFGFSSAQATTDLDDIRGRYVQPAAETLANSVDSTVMDSVYKDIYNSVGTLGTTPSAALTFLQAGVKLSDGACGDERRVAVLDPLANATLASSTSLVFHPGPQIAENWRAGQFAMNQLGIAKWFQDQNVPKFTSGAITVNSTPLVNGAGQTGSSLVTDGWGSGGAALKKGDIITIAGVYQVNPLSKVSTGRLQQFVLTADISDTAGAITMSASTERGPDVESSENRKFTFPFGTGISTITVSLSMTDTAGSSSSSSAPSASTEPPAAK